MDIKTYTKLEAKNIEIATFQAFFNFILLEWAERKGENTMNNGKTFETSGVSGDLSLLVKVDKKAMAVLETLDKERLVASMNYSVVDKEYIALHIFVANLFGSTKEDI